MIDQKEPQNAYYLRNGSVAGEVHKTNALLVWHVNKPVHTLTLELYTPLVSSLTTG